MNETGHQVHLVCSWAPLLSGRLEDCTSPDDPSCEGGVAAVAAYLRHYSNGEPSLVIPYVDKQSPFVQMHRIGWSINRYIFNEIMGWTIYGSTPSLLTQNSVDFEVSQRDISDLQTTDMPLLLTNVAIPPSISWYPYTVPVHFDKTTGLAILSISNSNGVMNTPQAPSTAGVLDYVARINRENGCGGADFSVYEEFFNKTNTATSGDSTCWVPVIIYADVKANFDAFVEEIIEHKNPPSFIIDVEGNTPPFGEPRRVGSNGVWLVSYFNDDDVYLHHKITLSEDRQNITNVEMILADLGEEIIVVNKSKNVTIKDQIWRDNIVALRKQANAAAENNPVAGQSTLMPVTREGNYRRCKAGECEIGNLFTDAGRWWADADFSVAPSGGLRGEGWPAGDVKISNIWDALPFPNQVCTGTMNGVSLFRLIKHSVNSATFEGQNTEDGDKLLQVSGLKVVYNLKKEKGERLISIDVYDKASRRYLPVERLRLYKFVADSFMCSAFDDYPTLLVDQLVAPGEVPGTKVDGSLYQNVVRDYLSSLSSPYEVGIQGRLVNNTLATEGLNLVQTAADCVEGTFWQEQFQTCEECPDIAHVSFLSQGIEYNAVEGYKARLLDEIVMVNTELFDVSVIPRTKPSWLSYSGALFSSTGGRFPIFDGLESPLRPGERMTISLVADVDERQPGSFLGDAFFRILPGADYPGCEGKEISFENVLNISPEPELNQLGSIRIVGWVLAPLVFVTAIFLTAWVLRNRKLRIVNTLQPMFLVMISVGALIMGMAIIPLSIDDEVASSRGCSIACMATPWLLSIGFTIAMSALFSKLWRINKLFRNPGLRRMKVTEKDVMKPFATLFASNFICLVLWTVLEPLKWVRVEVDGEPWNTYGSCRSELDGNGTIMIVMISLVLAINVIALFVAGFQAYQARNISDEFSESKNMGVALFSWFQLMIVGFPVLYLIDNDNPSARYFLQSLLVFAISMSMLLLIFGPMLVQTCRAKREGAGANGDDGKSVSSYSIKNRTHISGLNMNASNIQHELAILGASSPPPKNTKSCESEQSDAESVPSVSRIAGAPTSPGGRDPQGFNSSLNPRYGLDVMESLVEASEELGDEARRNTGGDGTRKVVPSLISLSAEFRIDVDEDEGMWHSDEGERGHNDTAHVLGTTVPEQDPRDTAREVAPEENDDVASGTHEPPENLQQSGHVDGDGQLDSPALPEPRRSATGGKYFM